MNLQSKRIAALSRDHRFQFKTVVIILLAGMAVAYGISLWRAKAIKAIEDENGRGWTWVKSFMDDRPVNDRRDCVRLLEEIRLGRELLMDSLGDPDLKKQIPPRIPSPERIAELGPYEVLYSNADQDAAKQQSQAEAALASGVKVIVLDPVDSAAAVTIVAAANAQGIPVIAYDRLIEGGTLAFHVSFDNENVGVLQGRALVDKLNSEEASGGILMVNGAPTDGNAALFKRGALSVIGSSGFEVLADFDTPDWSPDKAQEWVTGQVTQ